MNLGINTFDEVRRQVKEDNLNPELIEFVIDRIDKDKFLQRQIEYAIKRAIFKEIKSNTKVKPKFL
jgi:SOS response regulatory protein OraA/RecX